MTAANDTLKASQVAFKELADYINAKDYQDDGYKKGDALNATLMAYGKTCYGLASELQDLYLTAMTVALDAAVQGSSKADTARVMLADWAQTRALVAEMAKGTTADMAKIGAMVAGLSELVDRRKVEFAADIAKPGPLARFYDRQLSDFAVRMRRLVRDVAGKPKAFQDLVEDRPGSTFNSVRDTVEMTLPGEILAFLKP